MHSSTLRQLPDTLPALAGVLIKRKPLSQAGRAEELMRQAKRSARALVREADLEAQECRTSAETIGYDAGFARAIAQITKSLERFDAQRLSLRTHVVDEVRRLLEDVLGEPELLLHIVDALAVRAEWKSDQVLRVIVPRHAKRIIPEIRQRLDAIHGSVLVVPGDSQMFVVESGEHILEFDPREVAADLTDAAQSADSVVACESEALSQPMTLDIA